MDWIEMVHYQQQMQRLFRVLLPVKRPQLTSSECELLAWLYREPEGNTPLALSQRSGMKKEAVSRCLKSLYEKGCIRREKQASDERSYALFLTETGLTLLKQGYESILQPFYDLWREHGAEFEQLLQMADRMVEKTEETHGGERRVSDPL